MNKYRIFDGRLGIMSDDKTIEAKSPMEALKKAGYTNIRRDMYNRSPVLVYRYHGHGSYVYSADMPK